MSMNGSERAELVWPKDLELLLPELDETVRQAKDKARLELFGRITEPDTPDLAERLGGKMIEPTMRGLEALLSLGHGDFVEVTFDHENKLFVAMLFEEYDPDDDELEAELELEDEFGEGDFEDEDEPGEPVFAEYADDEDGASYTRVLVQTTAPSLIEAIYELDRAYRNLINAPILDN